jgi:hypothetical protein
LQAYALPHDGTKLMIGCTGGTACMHASEVAAKDENLAWLQFVNVIRSCSFLFHGGVDFTEVFFPRA